jgi:SAM-dependent methyltransferase
LLLSALKNAGKDIDALTRADIAALDEFHIRGHAATMEIGQLADLQPGTKVLDIGCGIGGAARTLMTEFGCEITGLDIVDEYIETARMLNERTGYNDQIKIKQGDALDIPFENDSFDVVFSQHVTMNIDDKACFAEEVHRVLRPVGQYTLYEICAGSVSPAHYPVPWAGKSEISFLIEPHRLRQILEQEGFKKLKWRDVTEPSLAWNQQLVANISNRPSDAPPSLGLNLLMGANTGKKVKNMMINMQENRIKVIQGVMLPDY